MDTLIVTITFQVDTLAKAKQIWQTIQDKLADHPDITISATYTRELNPEEPH